MFKVIREGKAQVVTDHIESFVADGLQLASGRMLNADIIVTATGLSLNVWGDISMTVDGAPVVASESLTHRGIMFTGLPNFATVFGYLRSSWTLRADLVSRYICRVLDHMDAKGARTVVPRLRSSETEMTRRPWIDPENFNAGYILRGLDRLPKQGDRQPWLLTQDYFQDRIDLPDADLDDGTLIYANHSGLARDTA
jgi:cation diffusion facilitator CzcD-associated flavoprotein CzcO